MKTIRQAFVVSAGVLLLAGCQNATGLSSLVNDGDPDLIPLPAAGFCRDGGTLVVTIRNQGPSNAEASTTSVVFVGGGTLELSTPEVDGGRIATLSPLPIPQRCYAPACFFQVVVDSNDDVSESDENNNTTEMSCSPPS